MTCEFGKNIYYEEKSIQKNLNLIQKGDIIFFHRQSLNDNFPKKDNKYPGHCGIYLGNYDFIHCSRPKGKVIISNFDKNIYWKEVLVASKSVFCDDKILKRIRK